MAKLIMSRAKVTNSTYPNQSGYRKLLQFLGIALCLSIVTLLVFSSGLNGPFMFDDLTNITSNLYIKITDLNFSSLHQAALSSDSGPLGRPVAMISFALNYYFGSGFESTYPFKVTNLVIHAINGFLVFILFRALLIIDVNNESGTQAEKSNKAYFIGLTLAVFWLVHPIQTNAVHYVVQRMTTLSALFVLTGLVSYIYGRLLFNKSRHTSYFLLYFVLPVSFLLGLLSKENAILLAPFIVLVDFCFFRDSFYWRWLEKLDRRVVLFTLAVLSITSILALITYAMPGYAGREFTLAERLLSETRILSFYLSLIFFPLINQFGLFHDDIAVSTGLLDPVTTILSIGFLLAITLLSIKYRSRYSYLFFGWMWFLVAHSLESTFIALELIHEHRNYIALIGPLYACAGFFDFVYNRYGKTIYIIIASLLVTSIAFVSFLRSDDWKSHEELIIAESTYHPDSPRSQGALGSILVKKGHLQDGFIAMSHAYELQPTEMGYLINLVLINDMMRKPLPAQWRERLINSFAAGKITPLSMIVLKFATTCALNECRNVRLLIEDIAHTCANRKNIGNQRRAQCLYYEGTLKGNRKQYLESIRLLRASYNLDKNFLHPLFSVVIVHIRHGNYIRAKLTIEELIAANKDARFPRDVDLESLISRYNSSIPLNSSGAIHYNYEK